MIEALAVAGKAAEEKYAAVRHTLANGMELLLVEGHRIPNVAMYTFWKVGSRNEKPGSTGLSHFIEHMMFNGATKHGPGQFDRVLEAAGGSNNAYTSKNLTVYQEWFPSSTLETVFDLESDRIAGLRLESDVVESERGVVASERRTAVDSSNFSVMSERLWALAFTLHPYRWPVIGWMDDIQSWSLEALQAYFETYYSPNNATIVLVGDFETATAIKLAERYFGPLPVRGEPPPVVVQEPPQLKERRGELHLPAQLPAFTIGYHIPEATHPDIYALQLIETLLFEGQSSRLFRQLVDQQQMAVWVRGGFDLNIDPGLFVIVIQMKEGTAAARGEELLYHELELLCEQPVAEAELRKAKNMLELELYRSLKSIDGKADVFGNHHMLFDDYRTVFRAVKEFEKITSEDLQRVARRYFTAEGRNVVTLVPKQRESGDGAAS